MQALTQTPTQTASGPRDCGGNVFAEGTASCPFAQAVAASFRSSGGSAELTDVYSPVAGVYYDLTCSGQAPVECVVGRARILIY